VTITASGAGVRNRATLTVNPFATGPSVALLSLNPGSVSGGASSTYRGQFTWSSNPEDIAVRSSLGGSATRTVTLK